jgi:MFS family permease
VVYVIAYFAMYVALLTPVMSTLALKVEELTPATKEQSLGLVMGVGAFFAFVANPIAGALSDRTVSKLGMRRPWLIWGIAGGAAGLAAIALANQLWLVVVGWAVAQGCCNATQAALQAILPDQVPERVRAKVSGWLGTAQNVAPLVGIGLAAAFSKAGLPISWMVIVPAAIGVAGILALAAVLKDRHLDPKDRPPFHLWPFVKSFWVFSRANADFTWAWLGRFFIFLAFASYNTYQLYYLQARFGWEAGQALSWQLRLMVAQVVALTLAASIGGVISDRTGKRKIFVIVAAVAAGIGLGLLALAQSPGLLWVAVSFWGVGFGAYLAVDLALVTDVLPHAETEAAKNMGVFNIANALPQSLAPAVAPAVLALGATEAVPENYSSLFAVAAVCAIIGAVTTMFIRGAK